jgi:hypothetical protein
MLDVVVVGNLFSKITVALSQPESLRPLGDLARSSNFAGSSIWNQTADGVTFAGVPANFNAGLWNLCTASIGIPNLQLSG